MSVPNLLPVPKFTLRSIFIGFGKRALLEKGSFQKSPFSRDLENLEILEILENPQTVENKEESDHFLEIPENLETFRDSRDSSNEKTPFVMAPFSGPDFSTGGSLGFSLGTICVG